MKKLLFICLLVSLTSLCYGSDVIHKTTGRYLKSVHTPDYMNGEWLINPKLPDCESKYWKIVDDKIVEMTEQEKSDKDASLQVITDVAVLKAQQSKLIDDRIRKIAIEELKAEGKLPSDYTEDDEPDTGIIP